MFLGFSKKSRFLALFWSWDHFGLCTLACGVQTGKIRAHPRELKGMCQNNGRTFQLEAEGRGCRPLKSAVFGGVAKRALLGVFWPKPVLEGPLTLTCGTEIEYRLAAVGEALGFSYHR